LPLYLTVWTESTSKGPITIRGDRGHNPPECLSGEMASCNKLPAAGMIVRLQEKTCIRRKNCPAVEIVVWPLKWSSGRWNSCPPRKSFQCRAKR